MSKRKKKPNTFTHTSDKPYDRHYYLVHHKNGTILRMDDYMVMRQYWFERCQLGILTHVEVKDIAIENQQQINTSPRQ